MSISEMKNHMENLVVKMEFYRGKEIIKFTDEELLEFIELRKEVSKTWNKVEKAMSKFSQALREVDSE